MNEPDANSTPGGRGRRFRFSLRAMFVIITALACWLGWGLHQVRMREAYVARIGFHEGLIDLRVLDRRLPLTWRLLGAKREYMLLVRRDEFTEAEIKQILALFPEADIAVADHGSDEFKNVTRD